jgi:hypothetical protein
VWRGSLSNVPPIELSCRFRITSTSVALCALVFGALKVGFSAARYEDLTHPRITTVDLAAVG